MKTPGHYLLVLSLTLLIFKMEQASGSVKYVAIAIILIAVKLYVNKNGTNLVLPYLIILYCNILDEGRLRLTSNSGCICPGHILTFECTVMRGVATVWRGSGFNCSSSSNNEILLLDSDSRLEESIARCNDGAISGQIVGIENGTYTSQLSITISSDMIGHNIVCAAGATIVGSFIISTPIAGLLNIVG